MIQQQLGLHNSAFRGISETINHSTGGSLKHHTQCSNIRKCTSQLAAPELSKYNAKFENVISKNPDFKFLVNVAKVLRGEYLAELSLGPSEISKFANAPIVSLELLRFFSYFKGLLSPQRERYTVEHLKWALVVMCNNDSSFKKFSFFSSLRYFLLNLIFNSACFYSIKS